MQAIGIATQEDFQCVGEQVQCRFLQIVQKLEDDPAAGPVADDIGKLAEILLRHVGFGQTDGVELVHSDETGCADHAYPGGRIWHETDNIIRIQYGHRLRGAEIFRRNGGQN